MRPPDSVERAARFERRLTDVGRRRLAADLLMAAAVGALAFAAVRGTLLLSGSPAIIPALSLSALCITAVLFVGRRRWSRQFAAGLLERAAPDSHNVIVTAEELLRTGRGVPFVVRRVVRDAEAVAERTPTGSAAPMRGPTAAFVAASALAILAGAAGPRTAALIGDQRAADAIGAVDQGPTSLSATIVPPAYLGLAERTLANPERIEAIAGSRLRLTLAGTRSPRIRFGAADLAMVSDSSPRAEVVLSESGYLAIDGGGGGSAPRRLIPVVVTQDRAPAITIEAPGKDLLVPSADASVPVTATATDDHGLQMLELRYTKVSGAGEQYEFEEGRMPLRIDRASATSWNGATALALQALKLQPGDSLVYRVVGSDARPGGAGLASSETFFVEVAGPGQVSLAGFELPPDRERQALSQQMILLKLQRLRARERGMRREALAEESASIAAEQRAVRANFIFLTGGHVEDEAEEAAHSHEIQEGRLEHSARKEIGDAIAQMSRVEQALAEVSPGNAIPPARAAVEALERAFARSRYLLRSLPVRSRLDPSRRLTGDRNEARDSERAVDDAPGDPAAGAAREILEVLTPLASRDLAGADVMRLSSLAERALAVDPASADWQAIAAALTTAADGARGAAGKAGAAGPLGAALIRLQEQAARGTVPGKAADPRDRALRAAWAAGRGSR